MRSNVGQSDMLFLGIEVIGKGKYREIIFPNTLSSMFKQTLNLKCGASFMSPVTKSPRKFMKTEYSPRHVRDKYKELGKTVSAILLLEL